MSQSLTDYSYERLNESIKPMLLKHIEENGAIRNSAIFGLSFHHLLTEEQRSFLNDVAKLIGDPAMDEWFAAVMVSTGKYKSSAPGYVEAV